MFAVISKTVGQFFAEEVKGQNAFVYKVKGKGHPCTGDEALYRPYGP